MQATETPGTPRRGSSYVAQAGEPSQRVLIGAGPTRRETYMRELSETRALAVPLVPDLLTKLRVFLLLMPPTLLLAACTASPGEEKARPTGASTSATVSVVAPVPDALLARVNAGVPSNDSSAVIVTTARPTAVLRSGQVETMVIRDEDHTTWSSGRYRLVVNCGGTGLLVAHFAIGGTSEIRQLPPCTDDVATDVVALSLKKPASPLTVMIVPVGVTKAAVAYRVERAD